MFQNVLTNFGLTFIPIFVAIDIAGIVPIAAGLFEGLDRARRRRTVIESVVAAFVVGLLFLFLGKAVLRFLGITVGDFKIAGGVLLFVLAMQDIFGKAHQDVGLKEGGAVPLGVPIVAGPGCITALIMLSDMHGAWIVLSAFLANMVIVALGLFFASRLLDLLGEAGGRVLSKVAALLLAAFAVMMVRMGLMDVLSDLKSIH